MNLKKHKNDLLFLPLGGAGEIGMNVNLYHLDGKWLIVDFGAGFAEDFMPGIDMLVPDITFLHEIRDDIVGMLFTHAHEDHVGAVPYLWDQLEIPIYATPFTSSFLRAKMQGSNKASKQFSDSITEIEPGKPLKIGPFDLDLIMLTHSVPEMNAVVLKTPHGNVVHTGDWKIDPDPKVGPETDEAKLRAYGDEGVLAMVCDSTNVLSPGHSGSEGDLRESLVKLIGEHEQLVIVTTFASNVARIESVAEAAKANGRKLVLAGRSLWRIVESAKQSGYLQDVEFLEDVAFKDHARSELVIMATGCQGEYRAAMNKIIKGMHPNIRLKPDDAVIFASKIIPGNEKRIFRMFNALVKERVDVLTEKDHFVHVSGHPCRDELKQMYELVRPKIAVPVHGEHVHMHEHCRYAKEWGAKTSVEVEDGTLIKLAPGEPERLSHIQAGYFGVDGYRFHSPDSKVLRSRRRIQNDGVVVINLIFEDYRLIAEPTIVAPGLLDPELDDVIIDELSQSVASVVDEMIRATKKKRTYEHIINKARSVAKRYIKQEIGKEPLIEVVTTQL